VDYYLLLARDLTYCDAALFAALDEEIQEIKRMAAALAVKVKPT
jgi:hypothetical protein